MTNDTKQPEAIILPADEPKELNLRWAVQAYLGSEIWKIDALHAPITNEADLKAGDEIAVANLRGYRKMTVKQDTYGVLHGEDEHMMAVLKFGEDDRICWTSIAMVNKRAIDKLVGR